MKYIILCLITVLVSCSNNKSELEKQIDCKEKVFRKYEKRFNNKEVNDQVCEDIFNTLIPLISNSLSEVNKSIESNQIQEELAVLLRKKLYILKEFERISKEHNCLFNP